MSSSTPAGSAPPRVTSRTSARELALFASLCLIWGLTWIPAKVGVERVPPLLFATTRGLAAGPLLLAVLWLRGGRLRVARRDWGRVALVGASSFALTYGLLYWGMVRVDSGLTAVVNLSMVPVSLLGLGVLMDEERLDQRKLGSTALGIAGLLLLYVAKRASAEAP